MAKPLALSLAILLSILGIGLAIGAPFVVSFHSALAGLRTVSWQLIAALAASAAASAVAKAGKLHLMQTALGVRMRFRRTLAITLATDSAFLVSPFGAAGYGVNIGLLQRAGASWAQATTIVGSDQALDMTFFAVALPIALLSGLGPLAQLVPAVSLPVLAAVLVGVALIVCGVWSSRRRIAAAFEVAAHRFRGRSERRARLSGFFGNVRRQWLQLMTGPRWQVAALLLLTTTQWLLRYGALWFILRELGYRLPAGFVVAVQVLVLHAALWTGIPAGGGGGDLGLAAAFGEWVPRAAIATALILWRFATLLCPLALGAASFVALASRRLCVRMTAQ
ncbi:MULTISPECIES: lysylphosphatidylglycerol synthase transmembrane domain-containing protein [Paraburkholderia]|uniref:lysylphosphatidylglycerol synthase transmembrane domain-containing protein n=1 Tax=Paraburkholderia TaxID=1822464 RepID=UPI00225ADBA0|nr:MULTISPECIES: lysylphosphatidylglycerol synthase transmembrane domain-containing protein [Paraburkholderia]MCX4166034.1 lysylphosphatidylglycerol synthase transmembrane domain-containing protein [Paraburkholderia megapolitana]MDN7161524.1 flippase-like domain-containing protein [Paraburkholderia sp. CHISQ3]MDQ6498572.1 flippase-like domain-containing protein [Paraburkholderia megapolitana]